jgi:hypothetical protein
MTEEEENGTDEEYPPAVVDVTELPEVKEPLQEDGDDMEIAPSLPPIDDNPREEGEPDESDVFEEEDQ